MSIIDNVLVFLDDENELTLSEIKKKLQRQTTQSISSALGRLTSKGWVVAKNNKNEKIFRISPDGRHEITLHLNRIRDKENLKWDKSWVVVVFSIPEKSRRSRDLFRKQLTEHGFMRLHNELWVSFWDKRKIIEKAIDSLGISKCTTVFKINHLSDIDQKHFLSNLSWCDKELNRLYKEFINSAKIYLKTKKDGYRARLLVYDYSQALAIDPIFPEEVTPNNYLAKEAYNYYLKIRPFCYK